MIRFCQSTVKSFTFLEILKAKSCPWPPVHGAVESCVNSDPDFKMDGFIFQTSDPEQSLNIETLLNSRRKFVLKIKQNFSLYGYYYDKARLQTHVTHIKTLVATIISLNMRTGAKGRQPNAKIYMRWPMPNATIPVQCNNSELAAGILTRWHNNLLLWHHYSNQLCVTSNEIKIGFVLVN